MGIVTIGIATPPGMTAANGYFSAACALGYDRDEGLAFKMHYGEEPAATARAYARAPATLLRSTPQLVCSAASRGCP